MSQAKASFKTKVKEGSISLDEIKKRSEDVKVKIGIIRGTGIHSGSDDATYAQVLKWLEDGNGKHKGWHIFRTTWKRQRNAYKRMIFNLTKNVILGKISAVQAQATLGITAQNDIQEYMEKTMSPANKESTQLKKGRTLGKGVKVNNPMIETGDTVNKINWQGVKVFEI